MVSPRSNRQSNPECHSTCRRVGSSKSRRQTHTLRLNCPSKWSTQTKDRLSLNIFEWLWLGIFQFFHTRTTHPRHLNRGNEKRVAPSERKKRKTMRKINNCWNRLLFYFWKPHKKTLHAPPKKYHNRPVPITGCLFSFNGRPPHPHCCQHIKKNWQSTYTKKHWRQWQNTTPTNNNTFVWFCIWYRS